MKGIHVPRINARYWSAITLASVFGTNLGDFYAHESGLGIVKGLAVLCVIVAATFGIERLDRLTHEFYYWLVIIIIRTGATNIADYLAFRLRIAALALTFGLAMLLGTLAWLSQKGNVVTNDSASNAGLPATNAAYWGAMLTAGVFGTVLGDVCSHAVGEGTASLGLGVVLTIALLIRRNAAVASVGLYWLTVASARTAGTSIGDWLADNKTLNLGLPLSTLLTGCVFVAILVAWRGLGPRQASR